jgi:glucosamine-6-phosphate deaminase
MPANQRVFPDPQNPEAIPKHIEELGGVDMVLGGIALNGHIAFNEPEPDMSVEEFANLPTRVVSLSAETKVKDAILSRGGAYDSIPNKAISVGMKEILGARKLRLSMMLDMQRAVIRKACHGEVSAACPISLVQNHPDALLMVSKNVLEKPF